jgi:hypothetical protein
MSTKIEDLAEPFRTKAWAFIADLKANTSNFKCMGSDGFIVLETLRSQDTQIAYFSRLLASHVPAKYRRQAVKFVRPSINGRHFTRSASGKRSNPSPGPWRAGI